MTHWAYRLAPAAGYSRWQAFRGAFFNAKFPDRTKEIQAEMDASRGRLWRSGDTKIKRMILSDLVAEYDKLVDDPAAQLAYIDRIRPIDPDLADQVFFQHLAQMHEVLARDGLD